MESQTHLIEIALIIVAALGCGLLFERFRQPAVLGYIAAGIILSMPVFNLVKNHHVLDMLAELGVLMLLFLIGMELSLDSFRTTWHISLITTILQIGGSLLAAFGTRKLFGWSFEFSLLIGFAIALSSTAVAVKMLESIDELHTDNGRLALSILITQDLAVIPMLLFLKTYNQGFDNTILIKLGLSVLILIALCWYLTRRGQINFPFSRIVSGHHDLLPLAGLVFCFGIAAFSGLIGLSAAYGAFLGGLIVGNTTERETMIHTTKPIQSVLLMVFFLSIGLMMDLSYIWDHLLKVFLLLVFITIGKTFMNIFILHFLGRPWSQAFLVSLVLSQIGEFAFLFATVGRDQKFLDADGYRLIIVLATISLAISPLWLSAARRLHTLAPKHLKTFKQFFLAAYGPEIHFFAHLKDRFYKIWVFVKSAFQKIDS